MRVVWVCAGWRSRERPAYGWIRWTLRLWRSSWPGTTYSLLHTTTNSSTIPIPPCLCWAGLLSLRVRELGLMGDALGLGLLSRRSKKAGNEAFQRKDYQEAVRMYCQVRRNNTLSRLHANFPRERMCFWVASTARSSEAASPHVALQERGARCGQGASARCQR